jgi:hypothetical protein
VAGVATNDAPAVVLGADGVGKTWGTLAWLVDRIDVQPIVLVVASSPASELKSTSELSVYCFLAARLYELSGGVRDLSHWLRRLERLLKRPTEEGPILTVFFDGLNQEPSAPWVALLKTLQADPFAGRVRVIVSTRPFHFDERLSQLRGLVVGPVIVKVEGYDDAPDGELDQRLAMEGLTRADLHPDLVEQARTPRLFDLVVRLKDRVDRTAEITVHRLLWEYGRDAKGERAGRSFSEDEWRAWLREIADRYRDGVRGFSVRTLGETAVRPDLSERQVSARLSDIIDGRFTIPGLAGLHRLKPDVVAHALGATLLAQFTEGGTKSFDSLEPELSHWLDPIDGLEQRAEILRAAVSILVEQGLPTDTPLAGVLVTAWLQTQNITDIQRQEIIGLAVRLPDALLDAIEHSPGYVHISARRLAVNALRSLPREPGNAFERIVSRSRRWLSVVSRDVQHADPDLVEYDRARAKGFVERIGADESGPRQVVGVDLVLVDQINGAVAQTVPSLLEGYPLVGAVSAFEAAAVAIAVGGRDPVWESLKWLCLLNETDPSETAAALRALSTEIRTRTAEEGVDPEIAGRAAASLLRLTGEEVDETEAIAVDPDIDRMGSYEEEYLSRPGRSDFFRLERRHAEGMLRDTSMPLYLRIARTSDFWLDPTFEAPAEFVSEAIAAADSFDGRSLNRHRDVTLEDLRFEDFQLVLARHAPERLAKVIHAWLREPAVPADVNVI